LKITPKTLYLQPLVPLTPKTKIRNWLTSLHARFLGFPPGRKEEKKPRKEENGIVAE
jgi:hypothetical protein